MISTGSGLTAASAGAWPTRPRVNSLLEVVTCNGMAPNRWTAWGLVGVLIALTLVSATWSASTSPKGPRYRAVVTTSSTEPTTAITPTISPEVTKLGGTVVLEATDPFFQATPVAPKALLDITLDHVFDQAQPSSNDATIPGDSWVELVFTVRNADTTTFTDEQQDYSPPLTFVVDNVGYADELHAQPIPLEGYGSVDAFAPSRPGPCTEFETIRPGATATACIGFQLPSGVPVALASVALTLGDSQYGSLGEWLIRAPKSTTTTGPTPAPGPSLEVAHLGQTLTLTAPAEQLTTGPETSVVKATLDQVIDPFSSSPLVPGAGDRVVALRFTLSNVGNTTVPCYEGDEYQLSLVWAFDSDVNEDSGYTTLGLPANICHDISDPVFNGLAPGTTATGVIPLELPIGVPVVNALVNLDFAGEAGGPRAEWLVP